MNTIKPFEPQKDRFTIFDNAILDYVMPSLSGNEWKILSFIIRKTRGWQKEYDQLSYSQISKGTGIKNNTTISSAIKSLLKSSYILRQSIQNSAGIDGYKYALNTEYEIHPSTEIRLGPSTEIRLGLVQKLDTQKKYSKQKRKKVHTPPNSKTKNNSTSPPHQYDTGKDLEQSAVKVRPFVKEFEENWYEPVMAEWKKISALARKSGADLKQWKLAVAEMTNSKARTVDRCIEIYEAGGTWAAWCKAKNKEAAQTEQAGQKLVITL